MRKPGYYRTMGKITFTAILVIPIICGYGFARIAYEHKIIPHLNAPYIIGSIALTYIAELIIGGVWP